MYNNALSLILYFPFTTCTVYSALYNAAFYIIITHVLLDIYNNININIP